MAGTEGPRRTEAAELNGRTAERRVREERRWGSGGREGRKERGRGARWEEAEVPTAAQEEGGDADRRAAARAWRRTGAEVGGRGGAVATEQSAAPRCVRRSGSVRYVFWQ